METEGQRVVAAHQLATLKSDKYLEISKQRLLKIVETKMKTAFIGALAVFEETFGYLWGHGLDEDELTPEQLDARKWWEEVRTRILNNGNAQMRAAKTEIGNHIVHWNRYHLELKVK